MPTENEAAQRFLKDVAESIGRKDDAGKPDWTLMPWEELCKVQAVLDLGAKRYGAWNWQMVKNPDVRYLAALFRHVIAYTLGQDEDEESKQHHLAHAVCCCLFLMHFDSNVKPCNEEGCAECQKP
jgi:hypothetical protein